MRCWVSDQGFVYARQAVYQLSYVRRPTIPRFRAILKEPSVGIGRRHLFLVHVVTQYRFAQLAQRAVPGFSLRSSQRQILSRGAGPDFTHTS